ncbi:hypothetical protein [Candidatus Uabimicrobium sp. HlEnr_7]|uniref:hypothetical protein n=1 Tax=Candidatus Uabimicrobium helgolandensis TaxID=3095367 RepID=UPI003556C4A7
MIGLCENCKFVKKITNSRGSTFYLCLLAQQDNRFRKYPQLPVVECAGYEK